VNSIQIRDREARETLERMKRDCDKVTDRLKPVVVGIIEDLFDTNLQLGTLWKTLGIKDHNISSYFVRELGDAPWAYVTDCRFEVAAKLLRKTHLKIRQISLLVGYLNYQSFSRSFEKWSGVRPIDYRRGRDQRASGPPSPADDPLRATDQALAAGSATLALDFLRQAEDKSPRSHVEARRALAYHIRGVDRTLRGDVDRAFEDLNQAQRGYTAAKTLPARVVRHRRRLLIPASTDEVLLNALCPDCRQPLVANDEIQRHLRRALELVPRDLYWFEQCCDPCYRVVWDAIARARLGQIQDAWRAWWISESADLEDPETPPSLGRYIAALTRVEGSTFGNQKERLRYVNIAVDDAVELRQSLLEAQARIWRGSVLRAMAELPAAREEFGKASAATQATPWLAALHDRMVGILEQYTRDYPAALERFRTATKVYETLDPHIAGLLCRQEANVHFFLESYDKSIRVNERALTLLDDRRNSLLVHVETPINLAAAYTCLGQSEKAERMLLRCEFNREHYPSLAGLEAFTWACLKLERKPRVALKFFKEAMGYCEEAGEPLNAALACTYAIEAYVLIGDRTNGVESTAAALAFYKAAGSSKDTLVAIGQLRELLSVEEFDKKALVGRVRSIARKNGGWLHEA